MGTHSDVERFLQAVFPDWAAYALFANLNPPAHARTYTALDEHRDCYWSIAGYPPGYNGTNLKDEASDIRALVVDDVGTKVPASAVELALGPCTAAVATSEGNFQLAYRLDPPAPVAEWPRIVAAVEMLCGARLDGRNPQQLMRLPMGRNTKKNPDRKNFAVALVSVEAGSMLDWRELVKHAPPAGVPAAAQGSKPSPRVRDIGGLLDLIPNNDEPYDTWMDVLQRVKALALDEEAARSAAEGWSSKSSKHDPEEFERRWATVAPTRTTGLELESMAEAADPEGYRAWAAREAAGVFDDDAEPPPMAASGGWAGGYSMTHVDMAAAIVAREKGVLGWMSNSTGSRWGGFDPVMGRWVIEDHDRLMRSAVRLEIAGARAAGAEGKAKLHEAKWQSSVQSLLTRHSDLMIPFETMDADLDMFGVPGGVVRLGPSGAVEEAGAASQMVSRATSVRPAAVGTKGVAWERFLDDFTMGDPELRAWWQAFCGYCLTGHTYEHMVVFLYGPGGNGKSVFLDTLGEVMGPYHERAASSVFMASQGSKHMAMVADLAGARLVTSPDVPLGAAWDLGMLKPLTGGGTFKAQFMRENWFRFTPQFKLILAGNEKPILGAVDAAVRRRFMLVPALHVPRTVNKQLVDVLRGEKAAVLRWMIDGWVLYQAGGLPPCRAIEDATREYIDEQDTFGKWVGATLAHKVGELTRHRMSDLWSSWDAFRAADGAWKAAPVRVQGLSSKLREAGFSVGRDEQGAYVDQVQVTKSAATVF